MISLSNRKESSKDLTDNWRNASGSDSVRILSTMQHRLEQTIGREFIFSVIMMQNILLTVKAYLDGKIHNGTLSVMDSPPQSPDFNIIEAV